MRYILTDIEGTITSISFVSDVLFPYFRENIGRIRTMTHQADVAEALEATKLLMQNEGTNAPNLDAVLEQLHTWSVKDKKLTPLKSLQGIIWNEAYQSGEIKGHLYDEVPVVLKKWKEDGLRLGIFSSGSVAAQKLLIGHSVFGDFNHLFEHNFDTTTGGKREVETYAAIAEIVKESPENCLFLSDITEELQAASAAGWNTVQLCREGSQPTWKQFATSLNDITV